MLALSLVLKEDQEYFEYGIYNYKLWRQPYALPFQSPKAEQVKMVTDLYQQPVISASNRVILHP